MLTHVINLQSLSGLVLIRTLTPALLALLAPLSKLKSFGYRADHFHPPTLLTRRIRPTHLAIATYTIVEPGSTGPCWAALIRDLDLFVSAEIGVLNIGLVIYWSNGRPMRDEERHRDVRRCLTSGFDWSSMARILVRYTSLRVQVFRISCRLGSLTRGVPLDTSMAVLILREASREGLANTDVRTVVIPGK